MHVLTVFWQEWLRQVVETSLTADAQKAENVLARQIIKNKRFLRASFENGMYGTTKEAPLGLEKSAPIQESGRLKRRQDFLRIQRRGHRVFGASLVLIALPTKLRCENRVGFTVSKAVGKAHVRNLVKRRLRHIVFLHQSEIAGLDLIVLAKVSASGSTFQMLESEFLLLLSEITQKIRLLKNFRRDLHKDPTKKRAVR